MFSLALILFITFISALVFFLFFSNGSRTRKMNLPGGSLGYPVIGETLSFVEAHAEGQGPRWLKERIAKHGNVFKTSLMGSPTVFIVGQAGVKFILTAPNDVLTTNQPLTLGTIAGEHSLLEDSDTASRLRQVKEAMMKFLRPEILKHSVKKMDELISEMLSREVAKGAGEEVHVEAVGFVRKLTYYVTCDILFGVHEEQTELALLDDTILAFKALWSLPFNLPGTAFRRGIKARSRILDRIRPIVREERKQLENGRASPSDNIACCLLSSRDENGNPLEEAAVIDNVALLMMGSFENTASLACLMIWKLSQDSNVYAQVFQEQMEIKKRKEVRGGDGLLTWEDIQSMKFTWRVAQELMRIIPPIIGGFKRAARDLSFDGYDIPKGWQIFWASYGTHMDGSIFENPKEFDPSRFDKQSNKANHIPPYSYLPFGAGPRMCPGGEFARVEVLAIMHHLVTMHEWTQVNPEEGIVRKPMPFPSMGLPIKIKPISTTN